jgi:hypothetical protein
MQNKTLEKLFENFLWSPELGVGYYPVKDLPYDEAYFDKYVKMENTEIGQALNNFRVNLVNMYSPNEQVLDVGIGSGAFVKASDKFVGFDINKKAISWLHAQKKWSSTLYIHDNMTFWDSLEHIHDPSPILTNIRNKCFISCPIYRNAEHILSSKHFRKDEHCWYWTFDGLVWFMDQHNFELLYHDDGETKIGREDILSFVFQRKRVKNDIY